MGMRMSVVIGGAGTGTGVSVGMRVIVGAGVASGHALAHGRGQRVVGVGVRREEPHRTV